MKNIAQKTNKDEFERKLCILFRNVEKEKDAVFYITFKEEEKADDEFEELQVDDENLLIGDDDDDEFFEDEEEDVPPGELPSA